MYASYNEPVYSNKNDLNTSQGPCLNHNSEGKNPNQKVRMHMTPFI